MVGFSVGSFYPQYDFIVNGSSYIGDPMDHSFIYVTKKIKHLIKSLNGRKECLVFVESGIEIPEEVAASNAIVFSDNPQLAYAEFATQFELEKRRKNRERKYELINGYYLGENVQIGENAYIECGCFIDHDVKIGKNAVILSGSVIREAEIGDGFICNENTVIGDTSFTMAEDVNGDKFRIPSLGRVRVGNNVEIGALSDIERGVTGDTILEDYVKIDSQVVVGHESHLERNVEVTGGAIVAGFDIIGEGSFIGLGAVIKNRIAIGKKCIIGMGAVVIRNVDDGMTVIGNPAKQLDKYRKEIQ